MNYESRLIKVIVVPKGEPIFSDEATEIEICDEAAGEFIKVTQQGGCAEYAKSVCFDPEVWEVIKPEIDRMISECRGAK
jgi:hypothetical protein